MYAQYRKGPKESVCEIKRGGGGEGGERGSVLGHAKDIASPKGEGKETETQRERENPR